MLEQNEVTLPTTRLEKCVEGDDPQCEFPDRHGLCCRVRSRGEDTILRDDGARSLEHEQVGRDGEWWEA